MSGHPREQQLPVHTFMPVKRHRNKTNKQKTYDAYQTDDSRPQFKHSLGRGDYAAVVLTGPLKSRTLRVKLPKRAVGNVRISSSRATKTLGQRPLFRTGITGYAAWAPRDVKEKVGVNFDFPKKASSRSLQRVAASSSLVELEEIRNIKKLLHSSPTSTVSQQPEDPSFPLNGGRYAKRPS